MLRSLLLLVTLGACALAGALSWPVKEFRVVQAENKLDGLILYNQNPQIIGHTWDEWWSEASAYRLSDEHVEEIERWFRQVAFHFESQGFRAARYDAKGTEDGKAHFELLVIPNGKPGQGEYAVPYTVDDCLNEEKIATQIVMHPQYLIRNGKIHGKAYQDMAHELFHTVQMAYDMFRGDCSQRKNVAGWVKEGTAEAVGIDTARTLRGVGPVNQCQIGIRDYASSLYVYADKGGADAPCRSPRAYQTLSFWQFLGEYATRKGFVATHQFVPPDFGYLHGMFSLPHSSSRPEDEYAWISHALRNARDPDASKPAFGIGLHRAYARFAGTWASYWHPERRTLYPEGALFTDINKQRDWMHYNFDECAVVNVLQGASIDEEPTLALYPVSAGCIAVNFDFSGTVKLTFAASSDENDFDPDALSISTDGGKKILRRRNGESDPNRIGFSHVQASENGPTYFVVTNVARDAATSRAQSFRMRIVADRVTGTTAKAKKKDPSPDDTPDEKLDTAFESQSWTGYARQRDGRACTRPFEAGVCGPTTRIALMLQSDAALLLGEATQPGMSLEHAMSVFGALQRRGAQSAADARAALMRIQSKDAWEVDITVPQMPEGFTGSFDIARMSVAKAIEPGSGGGGSWRALGPQWTGPCPGGYHPQSGRVTIEEFSRQRLAGSFSARLIEPDDRKSCTTLPVVRTIEGTFVITDIDWGDDAPEISDDEIIDDIVDSSNEVIPGLIPEGMREYVKEVARQKRAEQEAQAAQSPPDSDGGSILEQCGCQCGQRVTFCEPDPPSPCCEACAPIFDICQGIAPAATTNLSAAEQAEVAQMRARYVAYVESVAPNAALRDQLVQAFDDIGTLEEKRLFMMAIPRE